MCECAWVYGHACVSTWAHGDVCVYMAYRLVSAHVYVCTWAYGHVFVSLCACEQMIMCVHGHMGMYVCVHVCVCT